MIALLRKLFTRPIPTIDENVVLGKDAVFTVAQLGPKRSITPEGFLFLEEVPICRTGDMIYGPRETPVAPGPAGYVIVTREESEVFRPEFLRSFEGKPFVLNHPPEKLITLETIKKYQRGHCMNPRRGDGNLRDFAVVDILVTCAEAIQIINDDVMREVSAGYTAEYEEIEPKGQGRARQYAMLGNHVALVKNARCGARCSIQDNAQGDTDMRHPVADDATLADIRALSISKLTKAVSDALKAKNITADEATISAEVKKVIDELPLQMPGGNAKDGTPVTLNISGTTRDNEAHEKMTGLEGRMNDLFKQMDGFRKFRDSTGYKDPDEKPTGDADEEEEKKKKEKEAAEAAAKDSAETAKRIEEETSATGDAARAATDSALLSAAHQEACSGAEILVSGITLPKFDAAAKPKATLDSICALRRNALELTYQRPEGKKIIDVLTGGKKPNFATMDCATERTMFRAAVSGMKSVNDAAATARSEQAKLESEKRQNGSKPVIRTAKDFNKAASDFWSKRKPAGQ